MRSMIISAIIVSEIGAIIIALFGLPFWTNMVFAFLLGWHWNEIYSFLVKSNENGVPTA